VCTELWLTAVYTYAYPSCWGAQIIQIDYCHSEISDCNTAVVTVCQSNRHLPDVEESLCYLNSPIISSGVLVKEPMDVEWEWEIRWHLWQK
jgi:hypothetical protein